MRRGADQRSFLGRVKPGVYCRARRSPDLGVATPRVTGSIDAFVASFDGPLKRLASQVLYNLVKVCERCGKANGHSLTQCNGCRCSLAPVALTETPNLFNGFVLGVEMGSSFPLLISLRYEDGEKMVFDDPLSLSPLHFCALPTTAAIPDWRYLTLHPAVGLRIHEQLLTACHDVTCCDFLADTAWRRSLLAEWPAEKGEWEKLMLSGYNFPPSQYQLHLQYMAPLLMPHQRMLFLRGVHFTYKRFFPSEYVASCLERLAAAGERCTHADLQLPVDDFVALLERKCGIAYDALHTAFLRRASDAYGACANWQESHFEGRYVCIETDDAAQRGRLEFHPLSSALQNPTMGGKSGEDSPEEVAEQLVFAQEKKTLENYGVQSNLVERPRGFYSHSKSLADLDVTFLRD